ncbi:MAG TPA: ABC transporter permease [Gemmatimonadota bacterium]|nr:ABC transporter permease [Gemmatimonadota bacterium]
MSGFALPAATLWWRECVRFVRDRTRAVSAIATAVLFWVLIGFGLGRSFAPKGMPGEMGSVEYLYPGTIVFVVLLSAIVGTFSLIQDRREGFLQGVLVAPVPRSAIALGKILGGTTIAVLQGVLLLPVAPLLGIPVTVAGVLAALAALFLIAFAFTALGFILAWRMESIQGFHGIVNLVLMPMWFLSGALFPVEGAARGLAALMRANPVTYGLSAFRGSLYAGAAGGPAVPASAWTVSVTFAALAFGLAVISARGR